MEWSGRAKGKMRSGFVYATVTINMQRGFVQIPILIAIVVGVLVLGGVSYVGVQQYQNYQTDKINKERLAQEEQQKLQNLIDDQKTELDNQQLEIQKIKNKPTVIINNQPATINQTDTNKSLSISDIIAQWTPSIVRVECSFSLDQATINLLRPRGVDTSPVTLLGSGLLLQINVVPFNGNPGLGQITSIVTNRHVLNGHNGFSAPSSCEVSLPDNHKYLIAHKDVQWIDNGLKDDVQTIAGQPYVIPPVDAGYLTIRDADDSTISLSRKPKICSAAPRIGDSVIILGYPSIGASSGLTATEGIISGIDGSYFVTSAKVEHGNSGGAAILKDQNCYLGIPSYVVTGELESLARILSFKSIFP